jgi:glycosyltransferase involved in cell wall biosynthesis
VDGARGEELACRPPQRVSLGGESTGLAHDYLLVMRGAERTFAAIAELAPSAPIYTLLYDRDGTGGRFDGRRVVTSGLQRLGVRQRGFRALLPVLPGAAARLPVDEHDLVVSSSGAFAHGVRTRDDATHVCYCHTPFRYAWFERERALAEVPLPLRPLLDATLRRIRRRDVEIARRVTRYVANSRLCQERIRRFWDRDAAVVHPPVDVERFAAAAEPEDFFLTVGEVTRHKRLPLALDAAARAGKRVVVVGDGPELPRLRAEYAGTHEFLGRVSDAQLEALYPRALALIVPGVEEFGIAAVEAQAAGRPVLGIDAGGLRETVTPGETGELVPEDDVDAMAEVLAGTDFTRYDAAALRRNAERFSREAFQERLRAEIDQALAARA